MSNPTEHLPTLLDALGGVVVSPAERAALSTVATLDADTVDGVARLLARVAEQGRLLDELAVATGRVQAHADVTRAYAEKVLAEAEQGRQALRDAVDLLAADRDRQLRRAGDADPVVAARAEGGAEATRYAISTLWAHTGVGEPLHVQPEVAR